MKKVFWGFISISLLFLAGSCRFDNSYKEIDSLRKHFVTPPDDARPGVYWYFMDGNLSKEGMTKDLESMKKAGIGSVVFLEVNVGIPRGHVDFLSKEWKDCFKHAVQECERLGISMILGIGPGWTGSGGPWVKAEESMQSLVSSVTHVTGGSKQTILLAKPDPMPPYFGEWAFTPELKERWQEFYKDVAVLAFPRTDEKTFVKDVQEKALYYRAPYSSVPSVKQFLSRDNDSTGLNPRDIVSVDKIVDLTDQLANGSVTWDVPTGEWTVMRVGVRNNGAVTRPAPLSGVGFECDKADTTALMAHLRVFTEELFSLLGERDTLLSGGLKILHMDSWEMGAQNWTPKLRQEFKKRRGYDPQPYYPVYAGYIVGNKQISERFLWDLRQTMQELMLENHSLFVKAYAHKHGMRLSIEPYDMNPMQDLELGASADIPMCEFWSPGGYNTSFSAVEGSSLANIKGQPVVPSEAFTAAGDGWKQHPASMKDQTDWAFAAGINRLTFHTFQHQALRDDLRPGMTMGPYGVHWDRNQTWWPYVDGYHQYVTRCQYMMQKGQTVADVLYLAPEEAPFVFRAPKSALDGDFLIDKRGHNFDACPPSLLYTASVENGKIKFPSGMQYSLLVLPVFETMTPRLLEKIKSLVQEGAVLVGIPPLHAPGLTDYPACDQELSAKITELWGGKELPEGLVERAYGKGLVYWGQDIKIKEDNLYPDYQLTSGLLSKMNLEDDFRSDAGKVRYIHKKIKELDFYFVSNRTKESLTTTCTFRVAGKQPQLWNPVNGEIRNLPSFTEDGVCTSIDLSFDANQSFFIIFDGKPRPVPGMKNFQLSKEIQKLDNTWLVTFDSKWGGPGQVEFTELQDWSQSPDDGIKYYSGTAVYHQSFNYSQFLQKPVYLDLGTVKNIAKVWLNGKDLGVIWTNPWEVEITDAIKEGDNELRIEVTNLWPNRLIGDELKPYDGIVNGQWPEWLLHGEKRPGDRYTFVTFTHYTKDSPLLESGLLGPVRIVMKE